MNAERGEIGHARDARGSPSLAEWRPGTDLPELTPGEVRVWLVDLDSGLSPDDVEIAEPGPELDVLADDRAARAARFVRARDRRRFARCRARCGRFWGPPS